MSAVGRRLLILCPILAALMGCAAEPARHIFVLGDAAPAARGQALGENPLIIEMARVTVPDYLDSTDILRRTGANEVTPSANSRWGERLSYGLTDALTAALGRIDTAAVVTTQPESRPFERITVHIETFEILPDGRCQLAARWRIARKDRHAATLNADATIDEVAADGSDAAAAAAMTRAVDRLAAQIAGSIALP